MCADDLDFDDLGQGSDVVDDLDDLDDGIPRRKTTVVTMRVTVARTIMMSSSPLLLSVRVATAGSAAAISTPIDAPPQPVIHVLVRHLLDLVHCVSLFHQRHTKTLQTGRTKAASDERLFDLLETLFTVWLGVMAEAVVSLKEYIAKLSLFNALITSS